MKITMMIMLMTTTMMKRMISCSYRKAPESNSNLRICTTSTPRRIKILVFSFGVCKRQKPGYEEDIDGEGDESNSTTTINTATRSPQNLGARTMSSSATLPRTKLRKPLNSTPRARKRIISLLVPTTTLKRKNDSMSGTNAALIQMGVPKALLEQIEREQELVDAVNDKKKKKNLDSFGEEKKRRTNDCRLWRDDTQGP